MTIYDQLTTVGGASRVDTTLTEAGFYRFPGGAIAQATTLSVLLADTRDGKNYLIGKGGRVWRMTLSQTTLRAEALEVATPPTHFLGDINAQFGPGRRNPNGGGITDRQRQTQPGASS